MKLGIITLLGSAMVACGGVGTPASHAQEAASNIAENERFGRTELVMQKVAPAIRADFIKSHAAWGGRITIADTELGNFKMEGTDDAEMEMRVTWYDQSQELRSTLLRQKWKGPKGDWQLVSETRIDGDLGLLGEKIVVQAPEEALPPRTQFPTVRIGAND